MLYEADFADFLLFIPYILLEYGADYIADLAVIIHHLAEPHSPNNHRTSIEHPTRNRFEHAQPRPQPKHFQAFPRNKNESKGIA